MTSTSNATCVLNKSFDQALESNVMPTPEQWVLLKVALERALNGSLTHNNLLAKASNGHDAHFIGIHPGDYDALSDALMFTMNDDLEIV